MPAPRGTSSVSDCRIVIWSIGTPSMSEMIIEKAVMWPWPWAEVPTRSGDRAVLVDLDRAVLDVEPGRGGDLDIGRQADAELLGVTRGPTLGLLGQQGRVVGGRDHGVEGLLVLTRVVGAAGDRGAREAVGLHEVDPADLGGVHADLVRGDVHDPLDQLSRLGATCPAVRPDRGVVREHRLGVETDLRDLVHADRHHLGEHRQDRPDRRIGTARGDDLTVEADDLAVVVDAEAGLHDEVATVDHRDHVLRTRLDPLDGLAELHRGLGGDEVFHVAGGLRAEAAADPRADDAELLGLEAQRRGVAGVDAVGGLVRHPHGETAVLGDAQHAVVLHRHAGEALADHRDLGDGVGTFARVFVGPALGELAGEAHVRAGVGEEQRRVGCEPVHRVDDRREGLDVGDDLLRGIGGLPGRFGDDSGDDVADEPDLVGREHRPVVVGRQHREALDGFEAQVVAGVVHRNDTGHRCGAAQVDRLDVAVGHR